ncbi:MAG: alcohol dehydrogenase catalytic domain-containing protein, partial [Tannerellaceae bacterium]|nr:alcohol dehydrogenase catalytic domain-containing protein [Tannerellaceae bacterium]
MKKIFLTTILLSLMLVPAMAQHNHAHSYEGRVHAKGMAMFSKDGGFQPYEFTRHAVGDNDILIEILYAGICHSDIHSAKSEWGETVYPIVPGHEIVGRVVQTGENVSKFKVGDHAGIGCIINSCWQCEYCKAGMEQFCKRGMIVSFASPDYLHDNELTNGGFSNNYVISEDYALKIPQNTDLKRVASLLCAGINVWAPIHFSQVKRGDTVGVAGFGGLGHMAVKYMVQMGAKVTVF